VGDQASLRDTTKLPSTYREHRMVDLKKDKKFAGAVQGLFVLVTLVAVGAALLLELPLETSWSSILTISVTLFACLIYMAVHEMTHGVVLQMLTKVKPSYAVRSPS